MVTLVYSPHVLLGRALSIDRGPLVVYACDELRTDTLSSLLYITSRARLQGSHFPIIPHSARPFLSTLMNQLSVVLPPTRCLSSLPFPLGLFLSLCLLFYLNPVSGSAVRKSSVTARRCPWRHLASAPCRMTLCMSVPPSVAHSSAVVRFPTSPELRFSRKRMGFSRGIADFSISGRGALFSLAVALKVC